MKRLRVIATFILLPGILITLALPCIPAVAQDGNAVLAFAPPALGLMPNTQGTVNILVENVQDLFGLEFQLAFDPDIIEIIDADPEEEGIQIKPAVWWKDGFVAVNQVDNRSGRIDFAATLLRPALSASGNLAVAAIPFVARKTGTSGLSVESAILSTRNADTIAYNQQAGKIVVTASGQAADMQVSSRSAGTAPGRVALAGAAILALITALGGFIYAVLQHLALRRR
jgi:hypothetical protein